MRLFSQERADSDQVELEDIYATLEALVEQANMRLTAKGQPLLPHRCGNKWVRDLMVRHSIKIYACDNEEQVEPKASEIQAFQNFTNSMMNKLQIPCERFHF